MSKALFLILLVLPLGAQSSLGLVGVGGPAAVGGGITLINASAAAYSTGASVTTAGISTTGATLLVVSVSAYNTANCTVDTSPSNSGHWAAAGSGNGNGVGDSNIYYAYNSSGLSTGGSQAATVNCSGNGGSYVTAALLAYSGTLISSTPLDQKNDSGNASGTTTIQPGSITPTQSGELIVSALSMLNGSFCTVGTPTMTVEASNFALVSGAAADLVQVTAATINPTWTCTAGTYMSSSIASFKHQ